jgi:hypothetical protein
MLEPEEVEPVRAATERFRKARADLEAQAEANLAELLARRSRTLALSAPFPAWGPDGIDRRGSAGPHISAPCSAAGATEVH